MRRIFFILAFLLIAAVAALGALGHLGKGPLAKFLHKGERAAEQAPPPPPIPHKIIYLGELITPIVKDHAIQEQIGIDVDIDVRADQFDRINNMLPKIDHRVRMELYDFLPAHDDTSSAADRQAVQERVQRVVENMVGQGAVRQVTIRTFYTR